MRYIWELHDIVPGRRFQSKDRPQEVWMVSYDETRKRATQPALGIVSTADGMISQNGLTVPELVNWLNDQGCRPMDIDPRKDVGFGN